MSEQKNVNKKGFYYKAMPVIVVIAAVGLAAYISNADLNKEKVTPSVNNTSYEQSADGDVNNVKTEKYKEGEYYDVLVSPIKVEGVGDKYVVKYLWLGCEHCQNFAPVIDAYKEANPDIHVEYRHAANAERWSLDARVFYALKETGNFVYYPELLNFYKKMREDFRKLPDYNDLSRFLAERNIDPQAFFAVADSDLILNYIEESINEMRENQISSVPTIIVNGKYRIKSRLPSDIESQEDYNDLVNFLINKK